MIPKKRIKIDARIEFRIELIINQTCKTLNLEFDCVVKNDRCRECSDARFIIVKQIRDIFGKEVSYLYIGKKFNRDNHLFAFQAELKANELIKVDKEFKEKYQKVLNG